jgi:hypothetical protein
MNDDMSSSDGPEVERKFVEKVSEYLLSLPFDLKILQEAVTDPDLAKPARLCAAATIVHTLLPQEGEPGPLRYVDDVLYVRAALDEVAKGDAEGAVEFRERFSGEVYGALPADLELFQAYLGELWPWLRGKLGSFQKLALKGKKPTQAVDDEDVASLLYDEGLEFQTNYPVNEEQVRNKVRRGDQILELLKRRYDDDKKKKIG